MLPNFEEIATGEIAGAAAATQMPNIACRAVSFKAVASNVGKVYIGKAGVTKPDGTTDVTTGWELAPSAETIFIPVANLSELFYICDNATDDLVYMALVK